MNLYLIPRDILISSYMLECVIQKAKGTPAARKCASEAQKAFFGDPENRHKRSIAMKGLDSLPSAQAPSFCFKESDFLFSETFCTSGAWLDKIWGSKEL